MRRLSFGPNRQFLMIADLTVFEVPVSMAWFAHSTNDPDPGEVTSADEKQSQGVEVELASSAEYSDAYTRAKVVGIEGMSAMPFD